MRWAAVQPGSRAAHTPRPLAPPAACLPACRLPACALRGARPSARLSPLRAQLAELDAILAIRKSTLRFAEAARSDAAIGSLDKRLNKMIEALRKDVEK